MKNYDKTPSFYNSEEVFNNFLRSTSYYTGIQECLINIVNLTKPKKIVELGSATGASTFLLAERYSGRGISIVGYDFRENIVEEARRLNKFKNVSFACKDMVEFAKEPTDADFVFMLYSFHHIVDPLENKIQFLKNLYKNMKKGAYVCVLETFIPENVKLSDKEKIKEFWKLRSEEAYASTFWAALKYKDLTKENIKTAEKIASFSEKNEHTCGPLVAKRENEYLVQRSWLKEKGKKAGFKVLLDQPINAIGEGVVLLQK